MISIIYGCLETAREFTCSKSCLASSSPIRTVCPCFPSLYVSTTPPPTPPPVSCSFCILHSSLSVLACCCAAAPALMSPVPQPLSAANWMRVPPGIIAALPCLRFHSRTAVASSPDLHIGAHVLPDDIIVIDFRHAPVRPRWRGFLEGGDVMKVRNM